MITRRHKILLHIQKVSKSQEKISTFFQLKRNKIVVFHKTHMFLKHNIFSDFGSSSRHFDDCTYLGVGVVPFCDSCRILSENS